MTPVQKARVASYAAFQIAQDDRGVGGAFDVGSAFDLLEDVGDPANARLVEPYLHDPRKGLRDDALTTIVKLRGKRR